MRTDFGEFFRQQVIKYLTKVVSLIGVYSSHITKGPLEIWGSSMILSKPRLFLSVHLLTLNMARWLPSSHSQAGGVCLLRRNIFPSAPPLAGFFVVSLARAGLYAQS